MKKWGSLVAIPLLVAVALTVTIIPVISQNKQEKSESGWIASIEKACPENVPIVGKWISHGEAVYMEVIAAGDKFFENRSSGTTVVTFDTPPEYWSFPPGNTGVDAGD